ncbi:MAG: hypothetical protein KF773_33615 [Deltaproteobacteria bacterium]|nr:hypothetical protein [Deltaproteobacteria bacterium]
MRILVVVALAACAGAPRPAAKGGPRGLHADEHLDVAARHADLARRQTTWPDTRSAGAGTVAVPWVRSWDPAADHARLAAIHRGKAAELQAAYDEACGARPVEEVAVSPLHRHGLGGWNTSTGAIVYLSAAAGAADRLIADLRCHRAWMMLSSKSGMDDCPLDLPGIKVDARGDTGGITLAIAVDDPKLVEELHRRIAHELEQKADPR